MISVPSIAKNLLENPTELGLREFIDAVSDTLIDPRKQRTYLTRSICEILVSEDMMRFSEYGELIDEVWMNKQQFEPQELSIILSTVKNSFGKFKQPVQRMQACVLFSNLSSLDEFASILLELGDQQSALCGSVDEIIWEMRGLIKRHGVSTSKLKRLKNFTVQFSAN